MLYFNRGVIMNENNYEQYDNMKYLKEELELSHGIVLSYGVANDLVPVGTFYVSDIKQGKDSTGSYIVELSRFKCIEDSNIVGIPEDKVYMPLRNFLALTESYLGTDNKDRFYELTGYDPNHDLLAYAAGKVAAGLKKQNGEKVITSGWEAEAVSLENLGANYYSNGELMGSNYSIAPFDLGRVLRRVKTR